MKKMQWILVLTLVWFSMPLNAQQSTQEEGEEEIASPKDTSRKKLIKIPPIPKIPKKVLSAADSIAQINFCTIGLSHLERVVLLSELRCAVE